MATNIDKGLAKDDGISRCDQATASTSNMIINNQHCVKQPIIRKIKPIPPPLDLSKRQPLEETSLDHYRDLPTCFSASPRSPASANQKHLPFRKRYGLKYSAHFC